MQRDSPRESYKDSRGQSTHYRDDRRDRYSRRDDDYERGGSRRDSGRDYGKSRDGLSSYKRYDDGRDRDGRRDRDRDRYRNENRDEEGGYGRGRDRDDDRRHDTDGDQRRDRDDHRPGPSRRSASPRARSSKPESPARSKSRSVPAEDKAKPNFGNSGLLAAATKTVQHGDGTKTVLKYHEPPEARKPAVGWRLYVFKGKEQVDLLHIHRQSAYLIGRDKAIVDIPIDHPSCSKQHAVIQYRQVQEKNEFGEVKPAIKPFIIDLESTNGTIVNDSPIPTSRYFELVLGDVIKFGESAREYVLLSEDAA
ncbi:SMAD/FHA domain-containing protein [Dichomitus squalens LYAD-421 SS1]|uniref:SMAD/FHA domain-containing protein n=1 Tax=Dichomitus squalens TaxID=114155 RepID=A0A4Q9Q4M1_9APHY|nr:SMAD/FHA domain-containing protein [Dichomitus squalens LYAD-421 SS1]EJF63437.1 SMAD/FHA domain-containing protein [Dichomitus squalens LYAD-421 SS1]TBU62287.1 SMAD/FHA domain-containing protein [Dichomitus squalens]